MIDLECEIDNERLSGNERIEELGRPHVESVAVSVCLVVRKSTSGSEGYRCEEFALSRFKFLWTAPICLA
jgi:hypothetical protein